MERVTILLITISLLLFACREERRSEGFPELESVDTIMIEEFIDSLTYIPLEMTSECILYNITQIIEQDNRFIILDDSKGNNSMFIFDNDGKYIRKIGTFGRGPDEYLNITALDVGIQNRNIYIYDAISARITVYDTLGNVLNSIKIDGVVASDFKVIAPSTFALYCPDEFSSIGDKTVSKGLLLVNTESNTVTNIMEYPDDTELIRTFNSLWLTRYDDKVGLISSINGDFYRVNSQGISTEFVFQFPSEFIPKSTRSQPGKIFKAYPAETAEHLFFYIYFQGGSAFHPVFMNKKTGRGKVGNILKSNYGDMPVIFRGSGNNRFYGLIIPFRLSQSELSELSQKLKRKIEANDNPIIVIYHLTRD
jgi:hypothetical protein